MLEENVNLGPAIALLSDEGYLSPDFHLSSSSLIDTAPAPKRSKKLTNSSMELADEEELALRLLRGQR